MHINPYFLRLNFPHPLVEDDASSAVYDPSTGYLTVTLTKEVPGQDFKDLDLLAKLLAPRPPSDAPPQPVIEVLDSEESAHDDDTDDLAERARELTLEQREILEGRRCHTPSRARRRIAHVMFQPLKMTGKSNKMHRTKTWTRLIFQPVLVPRMVFWIYTLDTLITLRARRTKSTS